ncbi:hypothetical protein LLG46_01260 [bacterium]|nr:hypothetical protein [bacterium]
MMLSKNGIVIITMVVICVMSAGAGCCLAQSAKPSGPVGLYDLDSSGSDIKYVLEALARRSGVNIVVSPDIKGDVSVHLKQMTIDSILDNLATVHGFAWEKNGDTYLIAGMDKFAASKDAEPSKEQTAFWQCKHSRPAELAAVISKVVPNLKAIEGPNLITPSLVSGGGMSSDSSSSSASSSSAVSTSTASTSNSSVLILIGSFEDIARAKDILAQIDVPRRQINIEVSVIELSTSFAKDLGTEWSWSDIAEPESDSTTGIKIGRFSTNVSAAVSASLKNGNSKLLAKPNISVLDNENAEILIGEKLLYPKIASYSDNGTPIYDKDEVKVGIYLQIAPQIAGDSDIVLSLYPQVSLVSGYLETDYAKYPQISTREARTTVSVRSGSTLAIGGLIQNDDIKSVSKFPILGDLPVIGSFFRHSNTTKEHTEIVIFLTPKIVDGA